MAFGHAASTPCEHAQSLGDSAAAPRRAGEWASLTARLAILRGRLIAGEDRDELASAAETFAENYLAFIEAVPGSSR